MSGVPGCRQQRVVGKVGICGEDGDFDDGVPYFNSGIRKYLNNSIGGDSMEWLEGLETDALLQAMEQQLQPDLPTFSVQQLFEQLLNGDLQLDLGQLLQQLGHAVWSAATVQMDFLGQLILLAIAFAVLRQLESSFSGGNIQKVTGLVIQSIAVLLILQSSQLILQECQDAINRMTGMMEMLLPIQMLLMAGLGNVKTAGLLQPSLLLVVQITAFCVKHFLMPLITLELLLKLVNSFSDTYKLSSLAAFLKKLILTGISFGTMLFLAILSIQGISGHALDRLSLRAVKYVTNAAVPVVGGMLSGLLDTLLSGGMMIRNAVGFAGLLVILLLTVLPALKILVLYFMYSFAAALLQPLGDSRMITLLEQTAGTFMLAFAVVALTGILFFFMILIVLAASGSVL